MILSVVLSDWNDLAAVSPVEAVATRQPAESSFQQALKAAVDADKEESREKTVEKTVAKSPVTAKNTVLPGAPQNIIPQLPENGVVDLPASFAAVDDLTPFIVAPSAAPGDRLNTALSQTQTTQTKELYRTDALQSAKQQSPYNMSDKARAVREENLAAEKRAKVAPADDAAMPMSKVKRFRGQARAVGLTNSMSKAKESVKKKTARVTALQADEAYRQNVRQRRIDSGELVNMTTDNGGKIGYDRTTSPSVVNKNNSAAASWFPEAMTRTLDQYEALAKARSQGMTVNSEI